jgi:tetratricopeptide (TPR) repeat protein
MKNRIWVAIGVSLVLLWAATELFAGRGGGRGGGGGRAGGGGRPAGGGARPAGGGARPAGGGARPGGGMPGGGGNFNRTPSFSPPGGGRPSQLPSGGGGVGSRPGVGSGPGLGGGRPDVGGGRPSQLPSGGAGIGGGRPDIGGGRPGVGGGGRPGIGGGPGIETLPSTRPDVGGRPGVGGSRPGNSILPGLGAAAGAGLGAAAGAGLGDRLGDRGPRASQLPANRTPEQRRQALQERLGGGARPDQLPARDWNQVRQDWQQNRDQIREDWQQHRDEAREDWQNWFDDHYGWYGGWYAGYAPGYWGRWDYLWDNYPVAAAVGLTWWGVNSLGYQFGYSDYSNPYYTESMPAYYSEPVLTVPIEPAAQAAPAQAASGLPPGVSAEAVAKFDEARAAFLEGRYDEALKLTDAALVRMPRDAVLHEFRAVVLFALQRYPEAAAVIHSVLDVGPGWDWKTLSGLYPSVEAYTEHLRALETAQDKDPKSAALLFLLGYHYLTCGHEESALRRFKMAAELRPDDAVVAALVATLTPRDAQPSKPAAAAAPKAVPTDAVVGAWTATGKGTAKYAMALNKDGTFTWDFTRGARKQSAKGVYTLEGNVLAMEPDTGGVLLAELTAKGQDGLNFKMVGGQKDDPGLDFRRGP